MTFRLRLVLAAVSVVLIAVTLISVSVFVSVERTLRDEVDDSLDERLQVVLRPLRTDAQALDRGVRLPRLGAAGGHIQLITRSGAVRVISGDDEAITPTPEALQLATTGGENLFETLEVEGLKVRVLTASGRAGIAVQVVRPLDELDSSIAQLRRLLLVIMAGSTILTGAVAYGAVRAVTTPIQALATTVERIRRTGDIRDRVEVRGSDELGRLASSFNEMLNSLEQSVSAQRLLIADVSHELRTPLTSLRTNIEVLRRADGLIPEDLDRLERDIDLQIDELSGLIRDVIDLGRDQVHGLSITPFALDEVVALVTEQARTHWPEVHFETLLASVPMQGDEEMVARAISNLVNNAAKHGATEVMVEVRAKEVVVSDNGPGIAPEDIPHVFDRFWRAPSARAQPGSGLGLAIVAHVARLHGGSVLVKSKPTKTTFWLRLP